MTNKRIVEVRTTSKEVIRLLLERLRTRSWLELDKDMRMRRIELLSSEVAWVLRVQKNATRAWEFFKWAASRFGYKHDAACYEIMIDMLGRSSEYSLLEDLLAEMERQKVPYSVSVVNKLIGIYSVAENIDKAEQSYLKLEQLSLRPNAYTYKCMLQAFAKAGRFSKAVEIYKAVQHERLPLDNFSYNMLLDALFKNGKVNAFEFPGRTCVRFLLGIIYNDHGFFNCSMSLSMARVLWVTIHCLPWFAILCQSLFWCTIYHEYVNTKRAPISSILRGCTSSCSYSHLQEVANGQEESAWNVFKDMKQNGNGPDVYTYTILARSLGQAGMVNRALELLDEMAAAGVEPNRYMFNTLLSELAKQDKVDEGMNLFKKMLKDGIDPDFGSYRAILRLLCKGRQLGGAFELLKLLKEQAVRKEAYESFIKILGRMGYIREVRMLFQRMQDENLKPNGGVYLSMIDALCRASEPDEALVVMKDMNQNGHQPHTTICNLLIAALGKSNKSQLANELFQQMKEKGPPPDTITYNCLIAGFVKAGKVGLAEDLFDEMERSGCMPNVVSYNSLIHSFARVGDIDSARRLLQLMVDKGITPDVITYNCVIECFGRAGKADTALAVFEEMREKGCSPSFVTYNNVLLALARAGMVESVLSLYEQMKEQGLVPDAMTFRVLKRVYETSPHLDKTQLKAEIQSAGLSYEVSV